MVTETPNLKLKKPAGTDLVDISQLNANADILDTEVAGKLDKSGGTLTGPIMLADGDGKGINLPSNGTINGPGTATLFGFLSGNFTVGSTVWPTNIRGMGTKPTYNGANMALMSDIPDISGLATSQALTDGLAGKQDTGDYLEVSAEDYVERAHTWFRNTVWAKNLQCDNFSTSGNFTAGWLKSSAVSDLNAIPNLYPVFRDDKWIYSRTRAEMISDLGIDLCALKSDITSVYRVMGSCTTADLANKAETKGDVWNLTDAGSYGPAGTNVVYNGTEWDALGGTIDLSGYATNSRVDGIAPSASFDDSSRVLTISVNGKSATATIPGGGAQVEVVDTWQ